MSRIGLIKRNPSTLPNAAPGSVDLIVDLNGNQGTRDENGINRFGNFDGSPQSLVAQITRPALVNNAVVMFGELVNGITQQFARFQDNSVQQLTGPGLSGKLDINWNEQEGTPYGDTDTATAAAGQMVVFDVGSGETATLNIPSANDNVGLLIAVTNINDKFSGSNGDITLHPLDGGDIVSIGTAAGADAQFDGSNASNGITLRSLGANRWVQESTMSGNVVEVP